MEDERAFVNKFMGEVRDIRAQLQKPYTTPDALQQQLLRIYEAIVSLSDHERPEPLEGNELMAADAAFSNAWDEILELVKELPSRPNGLFLTVRFLLFICHSYQLQKTFGPDVSNTPADRARLPVMFQYIHTLDERLLSCLRQIWIKSKNRERFEWAMTHLEHKHSEYNRAAMMALSPKELWRVPGMTGPQIWFPAPGDAPIYERFEHATQAVFGRADESGRGPIIRQTLYSQGPLGPSPISYYLESDDDDSGTWVDRPGLRRSWQFVIDIRLYMDREDTRRLGTEVMTRAGLPVELQSYVLEDVEQQARPYACQIDLAEAYQPFPALYSPEDKCATCASGPAEQGSDDNGSRARTCPRKNITIWNLGLRAFHTFHHDENGKLRMCRQEGRCKGHHENDEWAIRNDAQLINHVRSCVRQRCGESATMSSVGLGPTWTPENNQDCPRKRPRWNFGLEDRDLEMVTCIEGGMYGLLPTMLHRKSRRNVCPEYPEPHKACYTMETANDDWMLGRSAEEEERVGVRLSKMHRVGRCAFPEYCQAIVGQMAREDEDAVYDNWARENSDDEENEYENLFEGSDYEDEDSDGSDDDQD